MVYVFSDTFMQKLYSLHTFHDVLSLTCRFHIMEPIVLKTPVIIFALTNFLGVLGKCGLGTIDITT